MCDSVTMINLDIQAFNRKLNNFAKLFRHVATVESNPNRKYFTRHGMHLNEDGEERLLKQSATPISYLVTNTSEEPVIILTWNNGLTHVQIAVEVHAKLEISLNQNNNSQGKETEKEAIVSRTSDREKKGPVTRNNDFVW
jgi:hypothetical protein